MEWSLGEHSVILEIDLDARQGSCLGFNDQAERFARNLDLESDDSWVWIAGAICDLAESR